MSKCQIFPRSFQFGHNFDLSVHFLGHHVHKDKEKQNTYQTTYQDWQKQWKQDSEGRCQILFHGFVRKKLRKFTESPPLWPQTNPNCLKWFKVVTKMPQSWIQLVVRMSPSRLKVFIPNTVTNTKLIWLFLISIAVYNKDKYKDKRINIPYFHLVFTLAFFGTPSEVSWKG